MDDLLPGGTQPFHKLDPTRAHHYSQLQLHRCLHDRNPLLITMEDKYASRALVASKDMGRLTELYHWSTETTRLPWADLPETLHGLLTDEQRERLIKTAEQLAEDIDYTRADFFFVGDEWYFGEFTNYHNSCQPQSTEWEELGGRLWMGDSA